MTVPMWLGFVLAAAVVGLIAWQMIGAFRRAKAVAARWKSLKGVIPFAYAADFEVPEGHLVDVVSRAALALASNGPWDASALLKALAGIRIFVASAQSWESVVCSNTACRNGEISGAYLPDSGMIVVNAGLGSMAHELAHVAELRLDGESDYGHVSWQTRGIYAAIAAFERVT